MQVAGVLVDLGLLPIEDIPQLPKAAVENDSTCWEQR
jgi:hypothetical protein